jgi:hypothetical protein
MTKYTFTFDRHDEYKFKEVLSRLDPDEFVIVQDVTIVDEKNPRDSDKFMIIEMEEEAALTFRLGMKFVKIRRERTEEELAEEEAIKQQHIVKIRVQVPNAPMGPQVP